MQRCNAAKSPAVDLDLPKKPLSAFGILNSELPSGEQKSHYNKLMPDDAPPKSSYELAMERLRKKDADAGITHQTLTDAQKAAVAEIRSFYESKLAELEVLFQGQMRSMFDPAQRQTREEEYRRDYERLTSERDAKIEKARRET